MIKQGFIIVNCLLIILATYQGVKICYQMITSRLSLDMHQTAMKNTGPAEVEIVQQPLYFYNSIARRNLFRVIDGEAQSSEAVNIESLEQTSLNLKLWGTVTGDEDEAYAVIEDTKERSQNLYRKGDAIQNASIKMILREKIVLNVNGKDEVLEMEKITGDGLSSRQRIAPPTPATRRGRPGTQTISLKREQIDTALKKRQRSDAAG